MIELLKYIKLHFESKSNYFEIFSKVDTRVEGWFKAELLILLEKLLQENRISSYKREFYIKKNEGQRNSIDFQITLKSGKTILVELKAITISQSAGTPRNLNFYFRQDKVGLFKDFTKLDLIEDYEEKYVIGFIYPKPSIEKWADAKSKIISDHKGWCCISNIDDYPKSHFISVWGRKQNQY